MVWAVTLKCAASPSTVTLPASRAMVRISEWRKFWAIDGLGSVDRPS